MSEGEFELIARKAGLERVWRLFPDELRAAVGRAVIERDALWGVSEDAVEVQGPGPVRR